MVDFRKCSAVVGPNTKQLWVYDEENEMFIDPPKETLEEIDGKTKYGDWSEKERLLDEIIQTNPDWLQDTDYSYPEYSLDI